MLNVPDDSQTRDVLYKSRNGIFAKRGSNADQTFEQNDLRKKGVTTGWLIHVKTICDAYINRDLSNGNGIDDIRYHCDTAVRRLRLRGRYMIIECEQQ